VPFGVMHRAVRGKPFDDAVAALQDALDQGLPSEEVDFHALAVRVAVQKCKVPQHVVKDICALMPSSDCRVAVRSSASSDLLEKTSSPGMYESVLGVDASESDDMEDAILQVWGSLFTLRAVQSRYAAGLPLYHGIAMGVLVQPMVSLKGCSHAFLALSKDVGAGDNDSVYIEVCIGLGETLASAKEPGTPYRLRVSKKEPHKVTILALANYSFGLHAGTEGDESPERKRLNYAKERLSTDQQYLEKLAQDVAKVATDVENSYGTPVDMEGVVLEQQAGREVHLVQARPIVEN